MVFFWFRRTCSTRKTCPTVSSSVGPTAGWQPKLVATAPCVPFAGTRSVQYLHASQGCGDGELHRSCGGEGDGSDAVPPRTFVQWFHQFRGTKPPCDRDSLQLNFSCRGRQTVKQLEEGPGIRWAAPSGALILKPWRSETDPCWQFVTPLLRSWFAKPVLRRASS